MPEGTSLDGMADDSRDKASGTSDELEEADGGSDRTGAPPFW